MGIEIIQSLLAELGDRAPRVTQHYDFRGRTYGEIVMDVAEEHGIAVDRAEYEASKALDKWRQLP